MVKMTDENSLIATVAAGSSARNAAYPLKRQGDVTWRLARTCFLSPVFGDFYRFYFLLTLGIIKHFN